MASKHSHTGTVVHRTSRHCPVNVINAYTRTTHVLTPDTLNAGRLHRGRYLAVSGQDVTPVSFTEAGRTRCLSYVLSQVSG